MRGGGDGDLRRLFARRLRVLLRKGDVERDLDDEVRLHVEMEAEDLVRGGMDPERARREAALRFGGEEAVKERVRDERGGRPVEDLVQDVRYGVRSLRRSPGFTASALLVLALGIGAATALFGVVYGVLLAPLPFPSPEWLVRVWPASPGRGSDQVPLYYLEFRDWRKQARTLSGLAVYSGLPAPYPYTGGAAPMELATTWVAGDFFRLLGVQPARGRALRPDDDDSGRLVVVLSDGAWKRLFGSDPSVVGRTITLDHRAFEVVGVMPPGFSYPGEGGANDIWVPLSVIPEDDIPIHTRGVRFLSAVARLAPGATEEAARQELSGIARTLEARYPDANAGVSAATVTSLRTSMVGDVRTALWAVLGAVGFLLLLASANVANLLLARGTSRSREVALRLSLGASSGRVTRQLLTESLLLGGAGGVLGIALAWGGTRVLVARSAGLLPRSGDIRIDATVLGAALVVTLFATALAGVLPALRATDVSPAQELREGGRQVGGGTSRVRLRRTLVAAEVALAVVLLVGAGLLIRSLGALGRVDPGFRTDGRIAMTITLSDQKHPDRAEWMAMYHAIIERLAALPEVTAAGAIRYLPFQGTGEAVPVRVPGLYEPARSEQRSAQAFQVSDDLFRALGMKLLRGRALRTTDGPDAPPVAVVNEAFQRQFFQGQDPLGREFTFAGRDTRVRVVGVVADVHHRDIADAPRPSLYIRNDQNPRIQMSYVVHTTGNPLALAPAMRRIVHDIDPDQTISQILPLDELTSDALARPRFFTLLLGGFAAIALVLAALGIYGVLAYIVRSRRREMGLRLALGASTGRVLGHVLRQGLAPAAAGLLVGAAAAAVLSRFLATILFGVEPLDVTTYVAVAAALAAVATAACLVPAWSAARVNPMESLRSE